MSAEREYASKGVAGTGLGLGIGGAATGVPALIMSIIALIREGNQQKAASTAAAAGISMAEVLAIMTTMNKNGGCWEEKPATHYDLNQAEKIGKLEQENAILKSENFTNEKLADFGDRVNARFDKMQDRMDTKFDAINGELREQAVYNATNTAGINCLKGQVAQLQSEFDSLTEIGIPSTHIIPKRCYGGGAGTTTNIDIDVIVDAVSKAMSKK